MMTNFEEEEQLWCILRSDISRWYLNSEILNMKKVIDVFRVPEKSRL